MEAKATGISAESNGRGFHCGACHDGIKQFDGRPLFAACSEIGGKECSRCHSQGKTGVRKYEYQSFTAKFPKAQYGINWEAAESTGLINPVDVVEGISIKKVHIQSREDFGVQPGVSWFHPVIFSHEKHSVWNGCELCHPEIFPTARRSTLQYSMFLNIEGRHCGACHMKVAFPLNNCQKCHDRAPKWAQR
jgi:c(7)-type cytochrome triheme protein